MLSGITGEDSSGVVTISDNVVGNFSAPVQTFSLRDRLLIELSLPEKVVSLILDSVFKNAQGQEIPLFAIYPFDFENGKFIMDNYEIVQIINDYYYFYDQSEETALEEFKKHIDNLIFNKQYKVDRNLLITSDAVFQSPSLEAPRKEEELKRALSKRKKMAMKGECKRKGFTSTSLRKEEMVLRSGDEATVWISRCIVCNYQW